MIVSQEIHEEWFTADELAVADHFKLSKRREEWLRARTAAKQLALERGIVSDPRRCFVARPTLIIDGEPSGWFVSLSHSKGWAAAVIDDEPVGVDIEMIRPFDERAAHLFLRDAEIESMQRCAIEHRLLHWWAAKEAAWKRRSGEFATLKQLPLQLIEERPASLHFDASRTRILDLLVIATSPAALSHPPPPLPPR